MKRNSFLPLSLVLALLLALFPAAQAADSVTPTPPDWVPAEEYAVFEGSAAYTPENWETILQARSEVAWGAINLGSLTQRRAFDALPTYNKETKGYDLGMLLEMALIETRLLYTHDSYVNGPYWTTLSVYLKSPDSELLDGLTDQQRYALLLWVARDTLRSQGVGAALYEWLPALSQYPQFSPEVLIRSAIFSEEEQAEYGADLAAGWVYLDGAPLDMDLPPEVRNERTMVPIRAVAEALGADVEWVADTQQIVMTRAGSTVIMTLDQTAATVDGQTIQMDVAPYATEGRTLIPARYVAEFFGQTVNWNGEARRVDITEDRTAAEGSNLETWALPMGAMLAQINGGDPTLFGTYPRSAKGVKRCHGFLDGGSWSIPDRDDLAQTVLSMTFYGHNASFYAAAADARTLTDAEKAAMNAQIANNPGYDWPEYMWDYTQKLDQKWGDRGILCWDLFRMSNLVQWGYTAGYVTYEEALALLEPAATLLADNFSSWDEAYENYLDGYNWWAKNNVLDKDIWETPRGKTYQQMKADPAIAPIFDDTLFQTGVIGLPE